MANIIQTFPTGAGGGSDIQVTSLPTASASELGKIYQYVGADTSSLTNGFFYECVEDSSTSPSTYDWAIKNVDEDETVEISKANFELLTPAEKNNGKAYFIPDMDVVTNYTVMGNRFDKANIYTTDERMVGSYLGKPLYQKTITKIGTLSAEEIINHNISDLELCTFIEGSWVRGTSPEKVMPINFGVGNYYATVDDVSSTSFNFTLGSGYTSLNPHDLRVTLQYTKTNDSTVSIGTGNDYSTDETVIGTWHNGKRIYQRTYTGLIAPASGDFTNNKLIEADFIDELIDIKGTLYGDLPINAYSTAQFNVFTRYELGWIKMNVVGWGGADVTLTIQYTKTTD